MFHCVIQGHNGEDNVGFTVLVDTVHGSNHGTESLLGSSDEDRDLLSYPRRLQINDRRQLGLEGKNRPCIWGGAGVVFIRKMLDLKAQNTHNSNKVDILGGRGDVWGDGGYRAAGTQ